MKNVSIAGMQLFIWSLMLLMKSCHGAIEEAVLFQTYAQNYNIFSIPLNSNSQRTRHQISSILPSSKFPSQSVRTVVVFGDLQKRNQPIDKRFEQSIEHHLSNVPNSVNELILAHHIPAEYLNVIYTNAVYEFGIKRLTFYSYQTTSKGYFLEPCEDFVMLEELTFEMTDVRHFNLKTCTDLKKLSILNANYIRAYDPRLYHPTDPLNIMNELSHAFYEVKSKSSAMDNWNRVIPSNEIALHGTDPVALTALGYKLNEHLKYLEVIPITPEILKELEQHRINHKNTKIKVRLHFPSFEVYGSFDKYEFIINDMEYAPLPQDISAFFPVDVRSIGIRTNAKRISEGWWKILEIYKNLERIKINCGYGVIDWMIGNKDKMLDIFGKVPTIELKITHIYNNYKEPKEKLDMFLNAFAGKTVIVSIYRWKSADTSFGGSACRTVGLHDLGDSMEEIKYTCSLKRPTIQ